MPLRTGFRRPPPRHTPSFEDDRYPERQVLRQRTALAIASLIGTGPASVFCMPSTYALCAKTINRVCPQVEFFGTDYNRRIADNVDELDGGKLIDMQSISVRDYISENRGRLMFDAGWLDYNGDFTPKRRREIINFANHMLRPRAILAVTMQDRRGARRRVADPDHIGRSLQHDLLAIARSAIIFGGQYQTKYSMVHTVFSLEKAK